MLDKAGVIARAEALEPLNDFLRSRSFPVANLSCSAWPTWSFFLFMASLERWPSSRSLEPRRPNLFPQSNLHHQEIQAKCVIPLSPPKQHLNPSSRRAGACVRALIRARLLTLQESNDKGLFKISLGKNNNSLLPGVMDCGKQKRSRLLLSGCLRWWYWSFYAELGRRRANTVYLGMNPIQTVLFGMKLKLWMCLPRFYTTDPTDAWT